MSPALTGRFLTTSSTLPLVTTLHHYRYYQLNFSVLKKAKPTEMLIEQYKTYKYYLTNNKMNILYSPSCLTNN